MREIKFRAWDKENKWMCFVGTINLLRDDDESVDHIEVYPLDEKNEKNKDNPWYEIYNSDLMQYTGLKDSGGKDIFEGDIIKKNQFIEEIYWDNYKSAFYRKNQFGWSGPLKKSMGKIIGNIYENPTL